jgi:hypothetical protein
MPAVDSCRGLKPSPPDDNRPSWCTRRVRRASSSWSSSSHVDNKVKEHARLALLVWDAVDCKSLPMILFRFDYLFVLLAISHGCTLLLRLSPSIFPVLSVLWGWFLGVSCVVLVFRCVGEEVFGVLVVSRMQEMRWTSLVVAAAAGLRTLSSHKYFQDLAASKERDHVEEEN